MNTEDSCKGVFSFFTQLYIYFLFIQYGEGLTDDQPPSIISDCPVI